jgi:Uncharacterized protein conserved in bacteria (DUF2188)
MLTMPTTNSLHVTPEGGAWAVKLAGSTVLSSVHPTQAQAIAGAWELVKDRDVAKVFIHDSDGFIYGSFSFRRLAKLHDMGHAELDLDVVVSRPEADDSDDPAARAEALRLAPSNARLRAGIGKYPPPPGDYDDDEEMPY